MSIGMPAATIAAAFVGGGIGAIFGPWLKHRFSRAERKAEHRREPYDRILAAARNLHDAAADRPLGTAGASDVDARRRWHDALQAYEGALRAADLDTTKTTRNLSDAYVAAVKHYLSIGEQIPDGATLKDNWDDFHPLVAAAQDSQSAYDTLRNQMQREIEG